VPGSDRVWVATVPEPAHHRAGEGRHRLVGHLLEDIGLLGLHRPVLLDEGGRSAALQAATGWTAVPLDEGADLSEERLDGALRRATAETDAVAEGSDRLSVVVLDHCARLSGGELAMARLLPACDGLDAEVVLAEAGPLVDRLNDDGIRVDVCLMDSRARGVAKDSVVPGRAMARALAGTLRYSVTLARRLRAAPVDLVVTNSLKSAVYGGVAGRLAGVPVVWHLRDRISEEYLPSPAVKMVRLAARILPSGVIANSAATLGTLHLSPGERRRLFAQPIGSPCAPAESKGRRRPGAAVGTLTVGMVGRVAPWKGQDVFLRAFARAFPDGGPRARVVGGALFGEEQFETGLVGLAADLGIADRVDFVGHSSDVEGELAAIDIAVHASIVPEPFGQVVVEAMAAGCAVIASDGGGPAEVVTHGLDGLLVAMGDVEALATAIRRLADDPVLRHRLGSTAEVSARRFTPDRVATEVEQVYRLVVGRHRLGRRIRQPRA